MEFESEPEPVIHNAPSSASIQPPAINADIPGAAATSSASSRTSPQIASAASSPATSTRSLKRSAEMMEEDDNDDTNNENDTEDRQESKRKRLSTDEPKDADQPSTSDSASKNKDRQNAVASTSKAAEAKEVVGDGTNAAKLVEEMGIELTCGCCTEMCYNPVIVLPCQHYYCGSCYTLWTRNGGVNCPSCRSPVTSIIPSRAIQSLIDVYLRAVPSRTRLVREREQADEIYVAGQSIRVPTPRPRSPELMAPQDNDAYYHPCPHCASPNDFNWSCPVPIISPTVNLTFATLLTASVFPVGHARCGSCEHIHAPRAPTSSKCDFCLSSFCGLVVPTRCHAKRIREQRPIGMDSLMDILGNPDVYEAFGVNAVEFDYLLDYLTSKEISPRYIYAEIAEPLASTADGWRPLLDRGIFPAVTDLEFAAPPPTTSMRTDPPPQEQQSSQSASPETAVDEAVTAETQPSDHDHEMTDNAPETTEAENETRSSEPPAGITINIASINVPGTQTLENPEGSSRDTEMSVDAARPPTPIIVPEPVPTPPAPEATLDALPVEVEFELPSGTAVVPPTNETNAVEQVVIVSSETNNNSGENDAEDDDEGDDSDRSVSPPPVSNPNESTQTNAGNSAAANANTSSSSTPPRHRGPHLHRICRTCAAEVFFWGARAWWIRERAKAIENGELSENVRTRKDCPELGRCNKEDDNAHVREFNHIPHPPTNTSTIDTATTAADAQPRETNATAEPTQATDDSAFVPPVIDNAPSNETGDSNVAVVTEAEERTSRPEIPSRASSMVAEGASMDVDPVVPAETTAEVRLSLLSVLPGADAEEEDHEIENRSAPEPELESPENSIPSNSSGLGVLVADGSGVGNGALNVDGEYSEKVLSAIGGSGDVHMVLHEESEPPITSSSARAA